MNTLRQIYRDFILFFFAVSPWQGESKNFLKAEIEFLTSESDYWRSRCNVLEKQATERQAIILMQREIIAKHQQPNPTNKFRPEIVAYEVTNKLDAQTWAINTEPNNTYTSQHIERCGLKFRPLTYLD